MKNILFFVFIFSSTILAKPIVKGDVASSVTGFATRKGSIYVATKQGIKESKDLGRNFELYINEYDVSSILMVNDRLLVATSSRGVGIEKEDAKFLKYVTTEQGLGSNKVNDLAVLGDKVYIATAGGLSILHDLDCFSVITFTTNNSNLPTNIINSVVPIDENSFAVGTKSGVSIFADGEFTTLSIGSSSKSNSVNDLVVTKNGLLVATDSGVYRIIDSNVTLVSVEIGFSSLALHDGVIYGGTFGDGVYRENSQGIFEKVEMSGALGEEWLIVNSIHSFNNRLYVTSYSGLISSDTSLESFRLTNLISSYTGVQSLFRTRGEFYVGSERGLFVSYDSGLTFSPLYGGIGQTPILSISANSDQLWLTTPTGVFMSEDSGISFNPVNYDKGLRRSYNRGVFVDSDLILVSSEYGLAIAKKSDYKNLQFEYRTKENSGLSSNVLYGAVKCGTTIFAGSKEGLSVSMDGGSNFSSWNVEGVVSVHSVSCDGELVVVGTDFGVYLSDDGGAVFSKLIVKLRDERVNSVYIDKSTKLIWVSSFRGVDLLDLTGSSLSSWGTEEGLSSPFVNSAIPTPLGGFFAGSSEDLTIKYPGGETLYNRALIKEHPLGASTLWIDSRDQLYYSTDKGLYVSGIRGTDFKLKDRKNGLKSDFIFKGIIDKDGNGWAATPYGIAISNNKELSFFRNYSKSNGLDAGTVFDLFLDSSGNIYLATSKGVFLKTLVEGKIEFELLKGSDGVAVSSLYVDSLGVIYAATGEGFKASYDRGDTFTSLSSLIVRKIVKYRDGDLLLSSAEGAYTFDSKEQVVSKLEIKDFSDNILAIFYDTRGAIYVGSLGDGIAISIDSGESFKKYRTEDENTNVKSNSWYDIVEDSEGTLYFSTGVGIFKSYNLGVSFETLFSR